jgi:hypothetical protein
MTSETLSAGGWRVSPLIESAFDKYVWIWIGLTFGLAAKYALLIKRGVQIRPVLILADVLLLPLVALIAYTIVAKAGADGETAALITAIATVGADRIVKLYTERFFRQVEGEVLAVSNRVRGAIREEVQTERSGAAVIADTIEGRAPAEYQALKSRDRNP